MFGFKKKRSLADFDDSNFTKTTFSGNITINGVPLSQYNDGKNHTIEVKENSILIDGKDETNATIGQLKEAPEEVEDTFIEDGSVYFENLIIKVDNCTEVTAEAPSVTIEQPTTFEQPQPKTDIFCNIKASSNVTIEGNTTGKIYCDDDIDIKGSFDGFIESSGDVSINGCFYAKNSSNTKCNMNNLDVVGGLLGDVRADGYIDIRNASIVKGNLAASDNVDITYIPGAEIDTNISSDDSVSITRC